MWSLRSGIRSALACVVTAATVWAVSALSLDARTFSSLERSVQSNGPAASASAIAGTRRTVLKRVPVAYPHAVSSSVVGAYVTVKLTVGASGAVSAVERTTWSITNSKADKVSGQDAVRLFTEAATTAASQWRFAPAETTSNEVVAFAFAASSEAGALGRAVRRVMPSAILDLIAAWYAPATEPVQISQGMAPPEKIVDVRPMYPGRVGDLNVSGVVVAELHIRMDGSIADARILRSAPIFDQYALNAVLGWKYNPVRAAGKRVEAVTSVSVDFAPLTARNRQ